MSRVFHRLSALLFGALLLSGLLAGCAGTPERIVLLPDASGKAGAVVVRSAQGEKVLDQPYATLDVASNGGLQDSVQTADQVKSRYAGLLAAQAPRPQSFVVRFESGSATALSADSLQVVDAMLRAVAAWPAPQLSVVGHTDRTGTASANDELSRQRARTVADLLVQRGVPTERIEVAGRGEREPLVATEKGVANATNRRVEIILR